MLKVVSDSCQTSIRIRRNLMNELPSMGKRIPVNISSGSKDEICTKGLWKLCNLLENKVNENVNEKIKKYITCVFIGL